MEPPIVSSLHFYPVKSCKGIAVEKLQLDSKGALLDRRWQVVDHEGRFLSQRTMPKMAFIAVEPFSDKLLLKAPKMTPCIVKLPYNGSKRQVVIWKNTVEAIDQGDTIAEWLTEYLGVEARLVYMPDATHRPVDPKYAVSEANEVTFVDAYPLLLISEASLGDLNWRLKTPVPMNRFRPNIVVSGCAPFEEDTWKQIRIGNVVIDCVKPCSRCVTITIDQNTGEKEDNEPMQTLTTFRKFEGGIMFGQNCIHKGPGTISVGTKVEILK